MIEKRNFIDAITCRKGSHNKIEDIGYNNIFENIWTSGENNK